MIRWPRSKHRSYSAFKNWKPLANHTYANILTCLIQIVNPMIKMLTTMTSFGRGSCLTKLGNKMWNSSRNSFKILQKGWQKLMYSFYNLESIWRMEQIAIANYESQAKDYTIIVRRAFYLQYMLKGISWWIDSHATH